MYGTIFFYLRKQSNTAWRDGGLLRFSLLNLPGTIDLLNRLTKFLASDKTRQEVTMVKLFDTPIFVNRKFFFEEICSVEDVADFLENWPEDRRDVAFETIELACSEAMGGGFPTNTLAE